MNSLPQSENLERFVEAQNPVYAQVLAELSAGQKASHWMWFVFPQLRGLGRSPTAVFYGLRGRAEALCYWQHPVLGSRLLACTRLMLVAVQGKTADAILASPDSMKFASCMKLFATLVPVEPAFEAALQRFFAGVGDELTISLLG